MQDIKLDYIPPHIKDLRERIKINDNMISKKEIINFVSKNKEKFEILDLSFFEFQCSSCIRLLCKRKKLTLQLLKLVLEED